jgi:hypothetical protein
MQPCITSDGDWKRLGKSDGGLIEALVKYDGQSKSCRNSPAGGELLLLIELQMGFTRW